MTVTPLPNAVSAAREKRIRRAAAVWRSSVARECLGVRGENV